MASVLHPFALSVTEWLIARLLLAASVSIRQAHNMLKMTAKIENQWERGDIRTVKLDFATIGELENFIAYNRAYIRELSFSGKMRA